jgi:hypothetical protein
MIALPPYRHAEQYPVWDYTLTLGGITSRLRLTYRQRQDRWFLDLFDADDEALVRGVMLTVDIPLLEDVRIPGLPPGALLCLDTTGAGEPCGYEDLGRRCTLLYLDADELQSTPADEYDIKITVGP